MANSFSNDTYRPAKSLAYIVMAIFGGIAVCGILKALMSVFVIASPDSRIGSGSSSEHFGIVLIGLTVLLESLLRLLVIVLFLIWLYRSFNNLSALKAKHLEFTPGWAVGWWFIPFANLVKPFQVVRELWNESDPEFDEDAVFGYAGGGTPPMIGLWWAAFLTSNIAGRIADAVFNERGGRQDAFSAVLIVASILQTAAAVLVLLIVKGVTERQEKRFEKLAATEKFVPPPPEFYQNG
ncbi:MAG: DUF4328 domain-containing protein [Acidobacteria bacterium]|nr:DUF4328 domain-containing protein [Acidobacteriota bacterium]